MQVPVAAGRGVGPGDAAAGVVDVVWARPATSAGLAAMLSTAELTRLASLRRPADRDRFVAAHALLRLLVAERWDVRPAEVDVEARCARCGGPHGRPVVRPPAGRDPVHVSLAHAGARVVVAATDAGPVGVDVEATRAVGFAGYDDVALAEAERRPGRSLTDDARTTTWVRKEAVLKAAGLGLSVDLRDLVVSAASESARLVSWRGRPQGLPRVHLSDLEVGEGHRACVALLAVQPGRVRLRCGDPWLDQAATAD